MIAPRVMAGLLAAVAAGAGPGAAEELPRYVGERVCLECHDPGSPGRPCSIEAVPEHARAFETLGRPEAVHIAALSGVAGPPTGSRICLGCHATAAEAGPRWTTETFHLRDGVQCEACHGAGSVHAAVRRPPESGPRSGGFARLAVPDAPSCTACHRERTSHREVLESDYRRPAADARYRTPVNLATSPDGERLYVVCENSDQLVVVDTGTGEIVDEIAVGRRPHDVAVSPDGSTLYVTNRLSDTLSLVHAPTGKVVDEIPVGAEPHGVIAAPDGGLVHVLNTAEGSISVIDAATRAERARLPAAGGPWSLARRPGDGSLWITNVRPRPGPFRAPPRSELTVVDGRRPTTVRERPEVPGANMLEGIAFVPGRETALFTLVRTKNLVPLTRLAQGWTMTAGLGVAWPDGRVDQVLLDEPHEAFPDPTDVAVSPDGRHALVTSGGADEVAVVDVEALLATIEAASEHERREILPNHLGTSRRFVRRRVGLGRNPRGICFAPDGRRAYVAEALDDSVAVLETDGFTTVGRFTLGGPTEVTETRRGERLFHSAAITFGRQFSCRSCHPDGHLNGLTFDIEADGIGMNPVDNRTLRGILDTPPFKWEGNNPTLRRQCGPRLAVFFTRLSPYSPEELTALVRYISTIERPPNRRRPPDGLTDSQRRGQIVFERTVTNDGAPIPPEHRCRTCHAGPYGMSAASAHVGTTMWFDAPVETAVVDLADVDLDIEQYGELGVYYYLDTGTPTRAFDVPHLNNLDRSAPYLHNGAASTLEEIWTRFDVLMLHGATSDLTRRQLNDLIAYLKSL